MMSESLRDQLQAVRRVAPQQTMAYNPAVEAVEDPIITRIRLCDTQRDWGDLKARYGHLSEFWEMVRREQ